MEDKKERKKVDKKIMNCGVVLIMSLSEINKNDNLFFPD